MAGRVVGVLFGPLVRASTYRRWVYVILGGALFVPFVLLGMFVLPVMLPATTSVNLWLVGGLIVVMCGAMVLVGLVPAVRVVESTAVGELLDKALAEQVTGRSMSWQARWQASGWFVGHAVSGGVISVITLALPPVAVLSFAVPVTGSMNVLGAVVRFPTGWASAWVPLVGLVSLILLVHLVLVVSAIQIRLAPWLLGPTATERLAAMERRAEQLAERNRLARELHDSVGHALSVVTVQASAAGRVLDTDPGFARKALAAIEESARGALEDLDHVLGLLREDRDPAATTPTRGLADLPALLDRTRMAGVTVHDEVDYEPGALPPVVSREAYRLVQECLTNVLRHAGKVPATLRLSTVDGAFELEVRNRAQGQSPTRRGGGRGLAGMRERVSVLGGAMAAGRDGGDWRVHVRIPLPTTTKTDPTER